MLLCQTNGTGLQAVSRAIEEEEEEAGLVAGCECCCNLKKKKKKKPAFEEEVGIPFVASVFLLVGRECRLASICLASVAS